MSRKWSVSFIDKGNCEIVTAEVKCYRAYNAPKVARKMLGNSPEADKVDAECVQIKVIEV